MIRLERVLQEVASANTALGVTACGNGGTPAANYGNTCIGNDAGRNIQGSSSSNTIIGSGAGRNIQGSSTVIIGAGAAGNNGTNTPGQATPSNSVIIGVNAGNYVNGGNNTIIGPSAESAAGNVAVQDVAIGVNAAKSSTGGYNRVVIGYNAAQTTLTNGHDDIIIGASQDTIAGGSSYEINIGGMLYYNNNSTSAPAVSACGTSPTIDFAPTTRAVR